MINLRLKADFADKSPPFVVKLKEEGRELNHSAADEDIGHYQRTDSTLSIQSKYGPFKVHIEDEDEYHGDVLLCIPEASRIQRIYRANSKNNTFLFTERCDQLCAMCSQPPKSSIDAWRFPHFQKTIELSEENAIIGISGGEPTLYKHELFDIIKNTAEKRPDVSFHILSNGQHFEDSDIKILTELHKKIKILWGIPLYSASPKTHDLIVGKEGAFNKLMENLFKLGSAGTAIELRTVLMAKNALDLPDLANFISKHIGFINKWVIMAMEPIGFARANKDRLFYDHSIAKFPIHHALDIAKFNGIFTQLYNFPLCTVDADYRDYCTQSISDWKNKYLDKCSNCTIKEQCCGFFEWYNEKWEWKNIIPVV